VDLAGFGRARSRPLHRNAEVVGQVRRFGRIWPDLAGGENRRPPLPSSGLEATQYRGRDTTGSFHRDPGLVNETSPPPDLAARPTARCPKGPGRVPHAVIGPHTISGGICPRPNHRPNRPIPFHLVGAFSPAPHFYGGKADGLVRDRPNSTKQTPHGRHRSSTWPVVWSLPNRHHPFFEVSLAICPSRESATSFRPSGASKWSTGLSTSIGRRPLPTANVTRASSDSASSL